MTQSDGAPAISEVCGGHVQLFMPVEGGPTRWRLLSGNNRELGRGTGEFTDAATAQSAIEALQRELAALAAKIRRTGPNRWAWELLHQGEAVIRASQPFDRMIRCEQAAERFVEQFRGAPVGSTVMSSAARRWRRASTVLLMPAEDEARAIVAATARSLRRPARA